MKKPQFTTHEKLFEALIYSANEELNKPIAGAYEVLKVVWFFINSDSASFNGNEIDKFKRPLLVNPVIVGEPEFNNFFEAEISYCSTQNKVSLKEQDFVTEISQWIEKKSKDHSISIPRKRKLNEFLEYIKTKALPIQLINGKANAEKHTAKHYVLAYLFECNAKSESYPIGNKMELESVGSKRMGKGKGNRFYKVFNEIISKDLSIENNLIEIGGENWREAVIKLSTAPEIVEKYLQNKQL